MPQDITSNQQEQILKSIERMVPGTIARLETKLEEMGETLKELLQVNENISLGSLLYLKGPLYWNAIFVEKEEKIKMYRISEYLNL